jgi:hypothetical protein
LPPPALRNRAFEHGHARAHRFRQQFFAFEAVLVDELQARGFGHVYERHLGRGFLGCRFDDARGFGFGDHRLFLLFAAADRQQPAGRDDRETGGDSFDRSVRSCHSSVPVLDSVVGAGLVSAGATGD